MIKRFVAASLVTLVAGAAHAAPPVRAMYVDAMAKEDAVRAALSDPNVTDAVLKAVRTVVADYEALVRHYPLSSYSDNALWQAGGLALDAFQRFGQQQDRETGLRLLQALKAEYPTSALAKLVPAREAEKPVIPVPPSQTIITRSVALPPPPAPAPIPTSTKVGTIKAIRRSVLNDVVRVTIEIDAETPFHDERISGPSRIFIDFSQTGAGSFGDQTIRFDRDADIVRQVRIGRHPNAVTRVVLDAMGVSSYSVYPLYSPYRLVIDCVRATPAPAAALAKAATPVAQPVPRPEDLQRTVAARVLPGRTLGLRWSRLPASAPLATAVLTEVYGLPLESHRVGGRVPAGVPLVMPGGRQALADARNKPLLIGRSYAALWSRGLPSGAPLVRAEAFAEARTASIPPATPVTTSPPAVASAVRPQAPGPASTVNGFSMARQLGLGVSRIVIDPGHGGHDPGAQSRGGSEAEIVLDVALRLEKLLEAAHNFEVILTRRTDEFVPLPERTAVANREGADLFLSVHVNASPSAQARGVETYYLNFATNMSAAAVAARENSGSGQAMADLPDFVKAIALNNKLDESRDFATLVQHAMVEQLKDSNKAVRNLGVKQAPFVVLIGASMPSVLAEISFLTNPQEGKLLKNTAYRQRIAEALFGAISKYQTSLSAARAVAHQR